MTKLLIKSLVNLYPEKVSLQQIQEMVNKGIITQEDFNYITKNKNGF